MSKHSPRLFCFDFDNTLVNGHFHNALFDMGVAPGKAQPAQIQALLTKYGILNQKELLKTFRQILQNGHHIAITTWSNYPEVVVPTLKKIGLTSAEIKKIHIESGIPADNQVRKNQHIARAKKYFGIKSNTDVFLIDDDELNIIQARKEGQKDIWVRDPQTDVQYLLEVQHYIKNSRKSTLKRNDTQIINVENTILSLEQVITGNTKDTERHILSLNGLPFYQSSGNNSAFAGTWFPFFGALEEERNIFQRKGWYIKPELSKIPKDVDEKMDELFPSYGSADAGRQLLTRFGTIPCLLISSWLGGGLWREDRGIKFKQYLSQKYPEFYRDCPTCKLLPATKTLKTLEEVNQWLCSKANVPHRQDLTKKMPNEVKDIQFKDGVTEKKNSKSNVQFASLDTQQGKRLFALRNKLKAKGHRPTRKRQDGEKPLARFLQKNAKTNENISISSWLQVITISSFCAIGLWALNLPILLASAIGVVSFTGMYLVKRQQQLNLYEAKQALTKNKNEWMQENKSEYCLGYRSKNWLPYLTSYLQPSSYFSIPYQVGLEDALQKKQEQRLCC